MKILFAILLFFMLFTSVAQEKVLEGIILDQQTKAPLEGASIYIPQTNLGTVSNQNGKYIFQVPKGTESIKISFLGYKLKIFDVGNKKNDTIYLEPYRNVLESVVVTQVPVSDILKEVIKNTNKKFKKSLVLTTYNREILKTDGLFSYYADAISKYHLLGDRKNIKSNMFLQQCRIFKRADYDMEQLMGSNPFGYDVTELVREGFSDFSFLNSIFRNEKKYDFELKIKSFGDGSKINVITFQPIAAILDSLSKKDASGNWTSTFNYFLFKGKITYDPKSKLLLKVRIEKNSNKKENAIVMESVINITIFDYHLEIDYRLTDQHYILTHYKKYQKCYLGKVLFKEYNKTFEFYQDLITLDYQIGEFDFDRGNRYKEKSLLMSEIGYTNPFWEQKGIVPFPELKEFIDTSKEK